MTLRRIHLAPLLVMALLLGLAVPAPAAERQASPWFGVLQPTDSRLQDVRAAGVTVVNLAMGWKHAEPTPGVYNPWHLEEIRARYDRFRAAGFQVVLDPGLQYPPAWVFDLDGHTRFVNQHGDAWHGDRGQDVPNAVFNAKVRAAQARYIAWVGEQLGDLEFIGVRASGLAYAELRYPEPHYNGHANSFWAFDAHALAASPVPKWRPGQPDPEAAARFLDWYLESLADYGVWLLGRYRAAFDPGTDIHVLEGSWGVRPGEEAAAAAASLDGTSRGERRQTLQQGLDWARQFPRFAEIGNVVVDVTWLEVEDQGDDEIYESPVRYAVRLARPLGMRVIGENSGRDGSADLQRSVDRVRELGLDGLLWMREPELFGDAGYATIRDYARAINGAGLTVLGGEASVAAWVADQLTDITGTAPLRLAGDDRYATAARIARHEFPEPVATVYMATGQTFPDALAGSAAAAAAGAPMLLVDPNGLSSTVEEELRRLSPTEIVLVGGPGSVPDTVVAQVRSVSGVEPTRTWGSDRFGTAAAVVAHAFPSPVSTVYVAAGTAFPDALSGSAAAARAGAPVLLVTSNGVSDTVAAELRRLKPSVVKVLGGPNSISDATVDELGRITGSPVNRIFGPDRYATALAAATDAFPTGSCRIFLATGESFPDALAGAAAAGHANAPLLLVAPSGLSQDMARGMANLLGCPG